MLCVYWDISELFKLRSFRSPVAEIISRRKKEKLILVKDIRHHHFILEIHYRKVQSLKNVGVT